MMLRCSMELYRRMMLITAIPFSVLLCTFWSCYGRTGVIKKFWEWAYKSDKPDLIKIWLIYFSRSSSLYLYLHLLMDFWTTFSVAAIFNSHSNPTAWQSPYV